MRNRLRRLERKARGDGIVLRLKDGTARAFETMEVHKAMFLAQMDLFRKTLVDPEVLDAVRNATPESRAASRGGKRGGRGRPVAEISDLKRRFEELAEDVLDGKVDRGDAAVCGQLLNYAVRAVGLKAKEVEELEGRLEELETLLAQSKGA